MNRIRRAICMPLEEPSEKCFVVYVKFYSYIVHHHIYSICKTAGACLVVFKNLRNISQVSYLAFSQIYTSSMQLFFLYYLHDLCSCSSFLPELNFSFIHPITYFPLFFWSYNWKSSSNTHNKIKQVPKAGLREMYGV